MPSLEWLYEYGKPIADNSLCRQLPPGRLPIVKSSRQTNVLCQTISQLALDSRLALGDHPAAMVSCIGS